MFFKKIIGIILIIIGFLALITPLTPGSWLIFIGLELLGIKFLFRQKQTCLFIQKIKSRLKKGGNDVRVDQKN